MPRIRALRSRAERGSVTAELAVLLPGVVVILLTVLVAAAVGMAQVRGTDAARAGARAAAIGQSDVDVVAIAQQSAGATAQVSVVRDGEWVRVRVISAVPLGPLGGLVDVTAELSAPVEPGLP